MERVYVMYNRRIMAYMDVGQKEKGKSNTRKNGGLQFVRSFVESMTQKKEVEDITPRPFILSLFQF